MKNKLYCYPTYEEARTAFDTVAAMLSGAAELGVTVTADWTTLQIRYVSEWSNQDVLFRFTYVPIKVSIDMERLKGYRGELHLFPLLSELHRCTERAQNDMIAFAEAAEEIDGRKNKGTTGTGKEADKVTQPWGEGTVQVPKV